MEIYAYCRVSTVNQHEDRQIDALQGLNIPQGNIFVDKQSGKDFERPAWRVLFERIKPGDLIYIQSIDRLGRSYEDIIDWWRILTKVKGADIAILDMPLLDTRKGKDLLGTLIADLILSVFSYVAHNERETIKKRQAEGIACAKVRGVRFGRPMIKTPENFGELVNLWEQKKISFDEILELTNLKQTTFYTRLREYRNTNI